MAVFGLSHRWTLNKSPLLSPTVRLSARPPICLSAHASAVASSERGTTQAIADEGACFEMETLSTLMKDHTPSESVFRVQGWQVKMFRHVTSEWCFFKRHVCAKFDETLFTT